MAFRKLYVSDADIARLRAIVERISKTRGVYWVFHPGELLALVAEGLRIIDRLVRSDTTETVGPSDRMVP